MALLGRKSYAYLCEWRVSYDVPSFASGGLETSAGASLTSYFAPDLLTLAAGIQLSVTSTTAGVDHTDVSLSIPSAFVSELHSEAGFDSSADATLEMYDLELQNTSLGLVLSWSAMKLYLRGVLKWTGGSGSVLGPRYAPSGIPLFGIPPELGHSGGFSPVPVAASHAVCGSLLVADMAISATGGVRWKATAESEFVSCPMYLELPTASMPEDCDCALPESAAISVTDTGSCTVRGGNRVTDTCELIIENGECDPCGVGTHATTPRVFNRFKTTRTYDTWGSTIWLLPDLEKSVRRWKDANYAQNILRMGFPRVTANAVGTCGAWGGDTDSEVSSPEVYPSVAALLSNVGNDTHAIEDVMQRRTIAPATLARSRGVSTHYNDVTLSPAICSLGGAPGDLYPVCDTPDDSTCFASEVVTSISDVETGSENPYILSRFDHNDWRARYIDTVCSPHWSYFVWFPPNTLDADGDGEIDSQDQWMVDGDIIPVEYWIQGRQQWGFQASLPADEKTKRRSSLPMDPLYTGHLSPIVRGDIGVHSNWWGSENFLVWDDQPPASRAYDSSSSSLISGVNCTLSFGPTGITATPDPGETTLTIEIDQGSTAIAGVFPFGYPLISSSIAVSVDPGNVASWEAQWVSVLGATKRFATADGTYPRPVGVDNGYAFSYAQDQGGGFVFDEGSDSLPSGESSTVMGDPITVHGFEMIAGRGAAALRFVIEAVSDSADVLIPWPTLYMPETAPKVFDENGFHQMIAWENGPAVRVGNVAWVVSGSISIPPVVFPPGYPPFYWKMSLVDALATALFLSGEDPTGAAALISDYLTADEYTTIDDAEGGSVAFFVDNPSDATRRFPLAVMLASYRETPPSVSWPLPGRDAYKQPTGDLAQQCWSHAEERVLILANRAVHLWEGASQLTALIASYVGWVLTGHLAALENDEGLFSVRSGATELGQTRPWHGFFGVLGNASTARNLDVTTDPNGLSWWGHVEDGVSDPALKVGRALGSLNAGFLGEATAVSGDVSFPSLCFLPHGRVALGYTESGSFKALYSDDEGVTWGDGETLMTGSFGRIWTNDGGDMMQAAVRADGGDFRIWVAFRGSGGAWGSEVALEEAGTPVEVEEDAFGLAYDYGTGAWMIYARRAGESDRTVFMSLDSGATWKEV